MHTRYRGPLLVLAVAGLVGVIAGAAGLSLVLLVKYVSKYLLEDVVGARLWEEAKHEIG